MNFCRAENHSYCQEQQQLGQQQQRHNPKRFNDLELQGHGRHLSHWLGTSKIVERWKVQEIVQVQIVQDNSRHTAR